MPVQRVSRPNHTFRGFQGQVEAGTISVGDEITTLPSNEKAHVKSLLVGDKKAETIEKGQPVTIRKPSIPVASRQAGMSCSDGTTAHSKPLSPCQ